MNGVWFSARYMCFCGTGARGVGRVWGPGFWRLLRLLFGVLSWRFLQIRLLLDQREEHEQNHADHVLTSTTSLIHGSQTERLHIKKALRSKHAKEKQAELELYMSSFITHFRKTSALSLLTHTHICLHYLQSYSTVISHDTWHWLWLNWSNAMKFTHAWAE